MNNTINTPYCHSSSTRDPFSVEQQAVSKVELLFYLSYIVFLVYMMLSTTFYYQHFQSVVKWKIVFLFCMGMLALYEFIKDGLTVKNFYFLVAMMLIVYNCFRIGKGVTQNSIAVILLFVFCARDVSFRKLSQITMITTGAVLAFVVLSSYAGIIPNYALFSKDRYREYLGFLYALYPPTVMSNITFLWIYYKKEKITVPGVAVFFLLNLFFFLKTDSRISFALTAFMLFFSLFLKKHQPFILRRKILCGVMVVSYLLAACISFMLTILYNPSVAWMSSLNESLEGRLDLGKRSLEQYGMRVMGIKGIKWIGSGLNVHGERTPGKYLYVDSYYIQIAQRYGIILLVFVLVLITVACYRAYKRNDIYLLSIFMLIAVHFIIDNLRMYLQYNTFWIAAGMLILSYHREWNQSAAISPASAGGVQQTVLNQPPCGTS